MNTKFLPVTLVAVALSVSSLSFAADSSEEHGGTRATIHAAAKSITASANKLMGKGWAKVEQVEERLQADDDSKDLSERQARVQKAVALAKEMKDLAKSGKNELEKAGQKVKGLFVTFYGSLELVKKTTDITEEVCSKQFRAELKDVVKQLMVRDADGVAVAAEEEHVNVKNAMGAFAKDSYRCAVAKTLSKFDKFMNLFKGTPADAPQAAPATIEAP